MVTDKIHVKLETILKEMEQEFIMMRFKFNAPTGKYKNEIRDIPGVGMLTTSTSRDEMFMGTIREKMLKLKRLLHYPRDQITRKRMAALRQHYFLMEHNNRNLGRGTIKKWSQRSADFCAGRFLVGIFDKHISYKERK